MRSIKRRATKEEAEARIQEALRDPNILSMQIGVAMKKYHLTHDRISYVRNQALRKLVENGDAGQLIQRNTDKTINRRKNRLVRAEIRYPGILRRMVSEKYLARAAQHYELTRERLRQLNIEFTTYIKEANMTSHSAIDVLESEAR